MARPGLPSCGGPWRVRTHVIGREELTSVAARADAWDVEVNIRAVVECLLTASYSEREIVDYLEGAYGLTPQEAVTAVRDTAGGDELSSER
jgi:hypothetical protein